MSTRDTFHAQPFEVVRPPQVFHPRTKFRKSLILQTILVGPPVHMQNVSLILATLTEMWVDKQTNKQTNRETFKIKRFYFSYPKS